MKPAMALILGCFLATSGQKAPAEEAVKEAPKEYFVGTAQDLENWPYRYTLVRGPAGWTGEIEYVTADQSIYFDTMKVDESSDTKISFVASIGRPGKALGMGWELRLSKSQEGYDGVLIEKSEAKESLEPIKLKLLANPKAVMPSSELKAKLLAWDDANYRTDEALRHELDVAKRTWEKEAKIAGRIAELRKDDEMRGGVRREWTGPAWIRERLKPEESKYFERICCVYLGGTSVTNADVIAISSLTELRELYLHSTGISDASLAHMRGLRALRVLYLRDTQISDQGLENLRTLSNLKEVYLFETKVSDDGGKHLRSLLQDAKIEW
jgi:hypothetical protein